MARWNVSGHANATLGTICIMAMVAALTPAARAHYKPAMLPANLNQASTRAAALNTLYELDLPPAA